MKAWLDSLDHKNWQLDYWIVGAVTLLVLLGLVMVFSSSLAISEHRFGEVTHYFTRQAIALILGLIFGALVFRIPIAFWQDNRRILFLFGLALLVAVLIFGREIGGSKRWLPLVIMNFQPVELVKIITIVFFAGYLQRHLIEAGEYFSSILRLSLPFGVMTVLLLMQPDYGSTVLILAVVTSMLFIAGAPLRYFVFTILPVASLLAFLVTTSEYRMARVTSFFDPWQDPFGVGYQLTQALIASGSGGWFGAGLGASVQKLLYLPDSHTDFLLSIFAEEFGFFGVFLLIALYSFLIGRMFIAGHLAQASQQVFSALVIYGIATWIGLQAIINFGVNFGLIPTKGLTLPFMSYGGSSLMMLLVAIGLVLRVDFERRLKDRVGANTDEQTN